MDELVVDTDDPLAGDVRALLEQHLTFAQRHSPPEDVHSLGVDGLLAGDVSFFSVRRNGDLLGVGALKHIDETHAEIKSMHTAAAARGQGVGRAMVAHLLGLARARGYRRVSLETGSMAAFAPARALYASAGFDPCGPFADYPDSSYSVHMTLDLTAPRLTATSGGRRRPPPRRGRR